MTVWSGPCLLALGALDIFAAITGLILQTSFVWLTSVGMSHMGKGDRLLCAVQSVENFILGDLSLCRCAVPGQGRWRLGGVGSAGPQP